MRGAGQARRTRALFKDYKDITIGPAAERARAGENHDFHFGRMRSTVHLSLAEYVDRLNRPHRPADGAKGKVFNPGV